MAGSKRNKARYLLLYLSANAQVKERRIKIKESTQTFDGKEQIFVKPWNDAVSPLYDIRPEFKSKMLILHNHNKSIEMIFSPDFIKGFQHYWPFLVKAHDRRCMFLT